jgi:hypothetical protein
MASLYQLFSDQGILWGTTSSNMAGVMAGIDETPASSDNTIGEEDKEEDDEGPESGDPASGAMSVVRLAAKFRMSNHSQQIFTANIPICRTEHGYP